MTSIGPLREELDQEAREEELDLELTQQSLLAEENGTEGKLKDIATKGKRILFAAEKGRLIELLHYIENDPSLVHYSDSDGYTPLHRACYGGHIDCAKYLLKKGANINAKTTDDWTPLHCAVRWNNIVMAEYLIKVGADVNARSNGGNTPLHIAASNGRYAVTCDIIQLLLYQPDCDYLAKNNSGDTAYSIAKRSGPFYKFWVGVTTLDLDEEGR